jgi:hypothetical protein
MTLLPCPAFVFASFPEFTRLRCRSPCLGCLRKYLGPTRYRSQALVRRPCQLSRCASRRYQAYSGVVHYLSIAVERLAKVCSWKGTGDWPSASSQQTHRHISIRSVNVCRDLAVYSNHLYQSRSAWRQQLEPTPFWKEKGNALPSLSRQGSRLDGP